MSYFIEWVLRMSRDWKRNVGNRVEGQTEYATVHYMCIKKYVSVTVKYRVLLRKKVLCEFTTTYPVIFPG